jgi:hypothetical protein
MSVHDAHDGWLPESPQHPDGEKRLHATLSHTMLWDSWPFLWDTGEMIPLFDWMLTCFHRRAQTLTLSWWEDDDESKEEKEEEDEKSIDKIIKQDALLTQSPTCAVEPSSLPQCERCATCGVQTVAQQVAILFGSRFHFCSPMCWHEWLKGL